MCREDIVTFFLTNSVSSWWRQPNDLGNNIFAATLQTVFKQIVMALTRQIRQFLTLVLVFMINNDANAEIPWLQDLSRDIFIKLSVENREMSKIGTMFDVV